MAKKDLPQVPPRLGAAVTCEDVVASTDPNGDALVSWWRMFRVIHTETLPARMFRFAVSSTWINPSGEPGVWGLRYRVVSPDGDEVTASQEMDLVFRAGQSDKVQSYFFVDTLFKQAGRHAVEILLDGTLVESFPLWVAVASEAREPAALAEDGAEVEA
jgi:hypothetical protein